MSHSRKNTPDQQPAEGIQQIAHSNRILIVDDDLKFCGLISSYLTQHGYDVTLVSEGSLALQMATSDTWQAVIMDVMLPGLNGYEVLRKIREASSVPILMFTALGEDETDRILGLEIGADDYLPKSFSPRELLARLRAVLRRGIRDFSPCPNIVVGPLIINVVTRTTTLNNSPLSLTPIEFELLVNLAQAKGRVKTREQLLEVIGGRNYDFLNRSIDMHISSLRKKLGDDPKDPRFIYTIRSAGYMLS